MRVYSKRNGGFGLPRDAVYVGRPSRWGNPFEIGRDGSRDEVVAKHRAWLLSDPARVAAAKRLLRGKDLVCWCAPLACHADTLMEIANEGDEA